MHRSILAAAALILLGMSFTRAETSDSALMASLHKALTTYVQTRAEPEHISAASLSVSLKGGQEINLAAGTTEYANAGTNVTPANLFQIGSITKSFTSVAILHLEAAGQADHRGHAGQVAAAISGVEGRDDPSVARHDEPDSGL